MNDTTTSYGESTPGYHHGEMDVSAQASTYRLFGTLVKWFSLHLAVLVLMLVLWFCLGAPFFGGLVPGLIVLAAGIYFLRATPVRNHDAE
jgi:hypothetical protein